MGAPELREWLLRARHADGSLGYAPSDPGVPEPTLHAVAAGLPVPTAWLSTAELGWSTWFAPAALLGRPEADPVRQAAIATTLTAKGKTVTETVGDYDGTIAGWTWIPDTFSWVEPTAWAIVGLSASGHGEHERVRQGRRLLRDRQGADGGWNYGNPNVLGAQLPAYPHSTAIALLALPPGPDADRAWTCLERIVSTLPSALNLALSVLASVAHHRDPTAFADSLAARQRSDGSLTGRNHIDALALLAMTASQTGSHPYAIHG